MTAEQVDRIKRIQNTQNSLSWGSANIDKKSVLFVVHHREYSKTLYIVVRGLKVFKLANDYSQDLVARVKNFDDCIKKGIIPLLKSEFPSR